MSIPEADQRKLCMRSGGICAFPDCERRLTVWAPADRLAVLGEMAHIVAESLNGPRGQHPLPLNERNRYENLILLCNTHHQQIDSQPQTWTVDKLQATKERHEAWVEQRLGVRSVDDLAKQPPKLKTDEVYATLLKTQSRRRTLSG